MGAAGIDQCINITQLDLLESCYLSSCNTKQASITTSCVGTNLICFIEYFAMIYTKTKTVTKRLAVVVHVCGNYKDKREN